MENKPWKLLHENTEYVEINYITKKKNEGLLVHVYFPYNSSVYNISTICILTSFSTGNFDR